MIPLSENKSLLWEFDWIDKNVHRYDSVEHAELVKTNIKYRYRKNAIRVEFKTAQTKLFKRSKS